MDVDISIFLLSAQFASLAKEVIQLASNNGEGIFLGVKSVSSMYYPWALSTGQDLPFVTIANLETMMPDARAVMKASSLLYAPLIQSEDQLARWNNYSAQNYQWVDEARFHRNGGVSVEIDERPMPFVFQFSATGPTKDDLSNGPLSPLWQYGPVADRPMMIANYNAAQNPTFNAARDVTLKTKKAVLSTQDFFGGANSETDPPSSMLLQPIINGFQHETNASIVAHLVAIIPWSEFFSNVSIQCSQKGALHSYNFAAFFSHQVLGEGQEVYIVVQSCDSNSTFKVIGSEAIFVGLGDKYEGEFRNLRVTGQFVNSTDADDEMGGCRHKVHVFPSDAMKSEFVTAKPMIYCVAIISIFFFSGFVFIIYDFFVTNRQNHTEKKAETSNAIVQELFPGNVAAKLYSTPTSLLIPGGSTTDTGSLSIAKASIADFYPASTILFADIAGKCPNGR